MELIKRTIITPVSENLSPITISLQRNDIGEYMVVTNQGKGKETTISYANTQRVGLEWYAEKIAETKKGLISMEIGFKILEHGN
jgi:hypothetical protein